MRTGCDTLRPLTQTSHNSGQVRSIESARVSIPALLRPEHSIQMETSDLAAHPIDSIRMGDSAMEQDELKWRTPLRRTEPYWQGMFCFAFGA